jgi:hypothetical protein
MDIYENIIIGQFIFGLGVAMGMSHRDSPVRPTILSLLQQTPLDQSLADVLIKNPGFVRLIEFKRAANKSVKEKVKLNLLSTSLTAVPLLTHLLAVSRDIHWYVESDYRESNPKYRIVSYLDLLSSQPRTEYAQLETFVEAVAREAASSVVNAEQMRAYDDYLKLLWRCQGSSKSSSGTLLLKVLPEEKIEYAAVNDMRDVFQPKRIVIERSRERSRGIEHERDWPERGIKHERDWPGRGIKRERDWPGRDWP